MAQLLWQLPLLEVVALCLMAILALAGAERVTFTSGNPFSFHSIIADRVDLNSQRVYGELRLPGDAGARGFRADGGRHALVIGVAGSKNWAPHHLEHLAAFRKLGIATFALQV